MAERDRGCVGFCGLACGVCKNACVPDCRGGGGLETCFQRECCTDKGIDGCWECEEFPCGKGSFENSDDPAWRGISIGSVRAVAHLGKAEYLRRVIERLGDPLEYGDHRYLDPDDVEKRLCGD